MISNDFNIIANYLLGVNDVPNELNLYYSEATEKLDTSLNDYEQKVWNKMLKSKFLFGLYDSGLSFLQPESNIRKKIFIALAILESNHHYYRFFINEKSLLNDFLKLVYKIPLAIFQAILGTLLIRFKL